MEIHDMKYFQTKNVQAELQLRVEGINLPLGETVLLNRHSFKITE